MARRHSRTPSRHVSALPYRTRFRGATKRQPRACDRNGAQSLGDRSLAGGYGAAHHRDALRERRSCRCAQRVRGIRQTLTRRDGRANRWPKPWPSPSEFRAVKPSPTKTLPRNGWQLRVNRRSCRSSGGATRWNACWRLGIAWGEAAVLARSSVASRASESRGSRWSSRTP